MIHINEQYPFKYAVNVHKLKNELRVSVLKSRDSLSRDEVTGKSSEIVRRIMRLGEFSASNMLMCYLDYRNEVETDDFIRKSLLLGKRIAVPVISAITDGCREMAASEISGIDMGLVTGTYGIREPEKEMRKLVEPAEFDMIVVPGVVFDVGKHRIGYGGGYYDRFIKKLRPGCIKVGVAFELQIFDRIPVEEHDLPVDIIITESRTII